MEIINPPIGVFLFGKATFASSGLREFNSKKNVK